MIIASAVVVVAVLSFVPWDELTGGRVHGYNMLSDVMQPDSAAVVAGNEVIDPELLEEMRNISAAMPVAAEGAHDADPDTLIVVEHAVTSKNPRVNGEMVIEDYTPCQAGMAATRAAIGRRDAEPVRIAVIGDSYIEGDIFTQDIRRLLQEQYGGRGVGYVPAHSMVAGFRRTVSISDNGWTQVTSPKGTGKPYFNISGEYFIAGPGASVTYKGYAKEPRLAAWSRSSVMFVAPDSGTITLVTDQGEQTFEVEASDAPQMVTVDAETTKLKVSVSASGLVYLGAWLEDANGVTVDCMSIRGDSGITHRKINTEMARMMSRHIDYDLIIMEYGINALSASQTNYDAYGNLMVEVVERLRLSYPHADILMLAIGDRGQKVNGEVHSLPTAKVMVEAQRRAAQRAGCLFWDMREAMGGEDAVVSWRERKLVNGDYIHLNSDGGREMAGLLVPSIIKALSE